MSINNLPFELKLNILRSFCDLATLTDFLHCESSFQLIFQSNLFAVLLSIFKAREDEGIIELLSLVSLDLRLYPTLNLRDRIPKVRRKLQAEIAVPVLEKFNAAREKLTAKTPQQRLTFWANAAVHSAADLDKLTSEASLSGKMTDGSFDRFVGYHHGIRQFAAQYANSAKRRWKRSNVCGNLSCTSDQCNKMASSMEMARISLAFCRLWLLCRLIYDWGSSSYWADPDTPHHHEIPDTDELLTPLSNVLDAYAIASVYNFTHACTKNRMVPFLKSYCIQNPDMTEIISDAEELTNGVSCSLITSYGPSPLLYDLLFNSIPTATEIVVAECEFSNGLPNDTLHEKFRIGLRGESILLLEYQDDLQREDGRITGADCYWYGNSKRRFEDAIPRASLGRMKLHEDWVYREDGARENH